MASLLRNNWPMSDERILNLDPVLLRLADLFFSMTQKKLIIEKQASRLVVVVKIIMANGERMGMVH